MERDLIYYPVNVTPMYETMKNNKTFQSDLIYREKYHEEKFKNTFNQCDTAKYADDHKIKVRYFRFLQLYDMIHIIWLMLNLGSSMWLHLPQGMEWETTSRIHYSSSHYGNGKSISIEEVDRRCLCSWSQEPCHEIWFGLWWYHPYQLDCCWIFGFWQMLQEEIQWRRSW